MLALQKRVGSMISLFHLGILGESSGRAKAAKKTKFPQSESDNRIVLNELSDAELESQNKIEASAEARTPIIVAIADTLRGAHHWFQVLERL